MISHVKMPPFGTGENMFVLVIFANGSLCIVRCMSQCIDNPFKNLDRERYAAGSKWKHFDMGYHNGKVVGNFLHFLNDVFGIEFGGKIKLLEAKYSIERKHTLHINLCQVYLNIWPCGVH